MKYSEIRDIINKATEAGIIRTRSKASIKDVMNVDDYGSFYHDEARRVHVGGHVKPDQMSPVKTLLHEIGHGMTRDKANFGNRNFASDKFRFTNSAEDLKRTIEDESLANGWVINNLKSSKSKLDFEDFAKNQVNIKYKQNIIADELRFSGSNHVDNLRKRLHEVKFNLDKNIPIDDKHKAYLKWQKHEPGIRKEISRISRENKSVLSVPAFDKSAEEATAIKLVGPKGGTVTAKDLHEKIIAKAEAVKPKKFIE